MRTPAKSISIERPTCKECGGYIIFGEYCLDHTDPELLQRMADRRAKENIKVIEKSNSQD